MSKARQALPASRGISALSAENAMVAMECALEIGHAANYVSQTIPELCYMRLGASFFAAICAALFARNPRPQGRGACGGQRLSAQLFVMMLDVNSSLKSAAVA